MFVAINFDHSFVSADHAASSWYDEAVAQGDGLRKVQVLRNALQRDAGSNLIPLLLGPWVRRMSEGCRFMGDQSVLVVSQEAHDWQSLLPAFNNRLWSLQPEVLRMVAQGCKHWLHYAANKTQYRRTSTKMKWLLSTVENVLEVKSAPRALLRRLDFVPLREALCAMPETSLEFLTQQEETPPVQLWAGRPEAVADFTVCELMCMLCRALKDDCWASMRATPVMACHRAVLSQAGCTTNSFHLVLEVLFLAA